MLQENILKVKTQQRQNSKRQAWKIKYEKIKQNYDN